MRLLTGTVVLVEGVHAGALTGGKLVHAGVVGVVHVVVDGVNTSGSAGITANRAAGSGGSLSRGVGDRVTTVRTPLATAHLFRGRRIGTYPEQPPWKVW